MGALEGRVAIITGAGNGIGREHALVFAREGARVVVNDLGCDYHGDGADPGVAASVVEEIRVGGGAAVANTSDVARWETGKELVEQALDEFGELHIVVNNAGVLRHAQLAEISEADLDRVLDIHIKGHFTTIRHASAYWRSHASAGRSVEASIVNTASWQGLYGGRNSPDETEMAHGLELAQSNYDAAKGAILALTISAAIELFRYGIRTNAICPGASTRLFELSYQRMSPSEKEQMHQFAGALHGVSDLMEIGKLPEGWPGESFFAGHPRQNSYLTAWLAAEDCPANGTVWSPSLGQLHRTWSIERTIPLPDDRWPTTEGIDRLAREHIGVDRLAALGRPRN